MTSLLALVKQEKFFLLAIFATALAVRLLFFNVFLRENPVQLAFDSGHYHHVAISMTQGKGFTNQAGDPYFYRVPGYPAFLAVCYKLFGVNPGKALIIQIILASFIPMLMFLLVLACFPAHLLVAKIVSVVSIFHIGFLVFSGLVMSETLFMIMFLLFLIFFFTHIFAFSVIPAFEPGSRLKEQEKDPGSKAGMTDREFSKASHEHISTRNIFLAGIFLGIASLIRPVGLVLVLFACAALYLSVPQRSIRNPLILLAAWLSVVSFWLLRNFLLTGTIFFHTLSGPHCINHGAVRIIMGAEQLSWHDAQRKVQQELEERRKEVAARYARPLQEVETSNIAEAYAVSVFKKYPIQTLKLCIINMLKTVFSLYSSELLFVDSGGQLPPYQEGRGIKACVMRFLHPEAHDKRIIGIIYAEIIMHLLILLGFFCFCVRMLLIPFLKIKLLNSCARGEPVEPFVRTYPSTSSPRAQERYPLSIGGIGITIIALGFITLFVGLSSLCGFARLRLPIEPFLIMLSVMFWMQILGNEREE